MSTRADIVKAVFRGLQRSYKSWSIEVGPLRATGVPAILIGAAGIVLASGVTAALVKGAPRLPETLSEARGLAEALTPSPKRLPS